jgi:hypothetical protein
VIKEKRERHCGGGVLFTALELEVWVGDGEGVFLGIGICFCGVGLWVGGDWWFQLEATASILNAHDNYHSKMNQAASLRRFWPQIT